MVYKIFKKNNYIVVVDDRNFYYEEHCSSVLVLKRLATDNIYDVVFVRPDNVPQAFYNIPFADIRDEFNAPYASVAAWETWYTTNTGCQGGANTAAALAAILATLQAQSEVEGVFVKDTANDKVVLQVRVWDQDSQTFINTLYFNPDGTPYTPVGPLEWVGTSGSTSSIITGPLGDTTTCGNAVAVTFCDALYTEFFDQGVDLSNIYDILSTSLVATVNQGSSPWVTSLDAATITALQNVSSTITGPLGVQANCSDAVSVALCQDEHDALLSINNAVNGTLIVSVTSLPAITGTVALDAATLAALESITVSGTVAVSSLPPITGSVSVTGEVEIINAVGSPIPVTVVAPVPVIQVNLDAADDQVGIYGYINGVSSTPTPLNVDASGVVAIQDNGGSITVDGTVAATQSGAWNVGITGTVPLPTDAATETTLLDVKNLLTDIKNNVTSKIERIKGAGDYERIITYADPANGDFRITKIVHKGTTLLVIPPAQEIVTETLTYYNLTDNVTNILYS